MGTNPYTIVAMVVVAGLALALVRFWLFVSTRGGRAKASRIAEMDAHLSFDDRLAERMRELEQAQELARDVEASPPPAVVSAPVFAPPPVVARGFGRRGL